jgi:hypothetical protein
MDFRYLIFQYDVYYPSGGINDLRVTFNDIEDVRDFIENNKSNYDNYHVYDRISGEQIHDLWGDELPQPTVIKSVCDQCRFENECRFKAGNVEQNCKFFIHKQTVL